MSYGRLIVPKASSAWYFVVVEAFSYNPLRRFIINSTPFSLAMSLSGISKKASCAPPSRDETKAGR